MPAAKKPVVRGKTSDTQAQPPKFKAPKNAATAVDKLYEVRQERLGLDRESATMKQEEGFLREYLVDTIPKSDATGVAGKLARATIETKTVPAAEDWSKIYRHIVDTYQKHVKAKDGLEDGAFALLNRALNSAAVAEVWEAGKTVPGVGRFTNKVVSLSKVT